MKKALVLFSGGQDSTLCLAWALSHYDHVETIGFDYNQRHKIELKIRQNVLTAFSEGFPEWKKQLGQDYCLDLAALGQISETSLTRMIEIKTLDKPGDKASSQTELPNSFVPARNLIFLTFAASLAYKKGITDLIGGMCEADYSGYPDCREETLKAQERALSLGLDQSVQLIMPLMHKTKAESWTFAEKLGGERLIQLVIKKTHTCYLGQREVLYDWGYGCGECPACLLRKKGYQDWITTRNVKG